MRSTHTQGTLKVSTCLHTTAQSLQTRKLKYFKVCTHHITITTMSHRWGTLKFQVFTHRNREFTHPYTRELWKKQNFYVPQCRDHTHTRVTFKIFQSLYTPQYPHTGRLFPPHRNILIKKTISWSMEILEIPYIDSFEKNNLSSTGILTAPLLRCRKTFYKVMSLRM